jgi:hypothetical protein
MRKLVLLPQSVHGMVKKENSQTHGVMLLYGNNNLQLMLKKLLNGVKETATMLMTLEVSTKTEKLPLMHKEKKMLELLLLISTILTKLV